MPDDQYERVSRALAEARTETGRRRYREVMVSDAPPPATPYLAHGVVDSVFGELWDRPGLSRRDRRLRARSTDPSTFTVVRGMMPDASSTSM